MVQYTAVLLEYGRMPRWGEVGSNDLVTQLPRDQNPRESILKPQPTKWSIGSSLPAYFTARKVIQDMYPDVNDYARPNDKPPYEDDLLDNPDNVFIPNPVTTFFKGFQNAWIPQPETTGTQVYTTESRSLSEFGNGGITVANGVLQIYPRMYRTLEELVQKWLSSSPCKLEQKH